MGLEISRPSVTHTSSQLTCETSLQRTSSSPRPTTRSKSTQKRQVEPPLSSKTLLSSDCCILLSRISTICHEFHRPTVGPRRFRHEHVHAQVPATRGRRPHFCDVIAGCRGDADGQGATTAGQTRARTDLPHRDQDIEREPTSKSQDALFCVSNAALPTFCLYVELSERLQHWPHPISALHGCNAAVLSVLTCVEINFPFSHFFFLFNSTNLQLNPFKTGGCSVANLLCINICVNKTILLWLWAFVHVCCFESRCCMFIKGPVLKFLKDSIVLQTPFALFKIHSK